MTLFVPTKLSFLKSAILILMLFLIVQELVGQCTGAIFDSRNKKLKQRYDDYVRNKINIDKKLMLEILTREIPSYRNDTCFSTRKEIKLLEQQLQRYKILIELTDLLADLPKKCNDAKLKFSILAKQYDEECDIIAERATYLTKNQVEDTINKRCVLPPPQPLRNDYHKYVKALISLCAVHNTERSKELINKLHQMKSPDAYWQASFYQACYYYHSLLENVDSAKYYQNLAIKLFDKDKDYSIEAVNSIFPPVSRNEVELIMIDSLNLHKVDCSNCSSTYPVIQTEVYNGCDSLIAVLSAIGNTKKIIYINQHVMEAMCLTRLIEYIKQQNIPFQFLSNEGYNRQLNSSLICTHLKN